MVDSTKTAGGTRFDDEEPIDLITRARMVLAHKWTILGIAVVFALIAAVAVFLMQPIYRATATVQIEPKQTRILNVQDMYDTGTESVAYYATQYRILGSRDLAAKAVERIDWSEFPAFAPEPEDEGGSWWSLLPFVGSSETPGEPDSEVAARERKDRLVDAFQAHTQIVPVTGTLLVKVHFLSADPELAKLAANTLSDVYIESGFEAKFETAKRATDWMNNRLGQLRGSLSESQAELQNYREEQQLVDIGEEGRGVIETELADNMQQLREARRKQTELENTYNRIQSANGSFEKLQEIPVLHDSEAVENTKSNYIVAQQELNKLASRYGPKHPKMVEARSKLKEARTAYHAQLQNAAEGIRTEYEIAAENVQSYSKLVEQNREELQQVSRKSAQLNILERETDTSREIYDAILTRFKQAEVEGDFQSLRATVIDPAVLPEQPYKPRKGRIIGFSGLAGLFLGVFLVFVREQLDDSISSSDEFEATTGLSVLANVPPAKELEDGQFVSRMLLDRPQSQFTEGIRTTRTGIVLSDLDNRNKRLLVTSALPQEGKSCIATNLALAFGQMERVLLIEGDLRRPTLARYLGISEQGPGLTELLSGEADRSQAVRTISEGLDFLPVGSVPPNPVELLSSMRFRETMADLTKDYDRVIYDSPPCELVSDTMLLARHVDATVFVVQCEKTGKRVILSALKRLQQARAPVVGAVLNFYEAQGVYQGYSSYYYDQG